jgi:hypothetical protein
MDTTPAAPKPSWPRVLAATLLAQVVLVSCAIAWVAIYSHGIAPGQPMAAYHAHAQASGPWVSLLGGVPVFYLLGAWLARHRPAAARASAIALAVCYVSLDLVLLLALAPGRIPWLMVVLNGTAKAAAAWLGASRHASVAR